MFTVVLYKDPLSVARQPERSDHEKVTFDSDDLNKARAAVLERIPDAVFMSANQYEMFEAGVRLKICRHGELVGVVLDKRS